MDPMSPRFGQPQSSTMTNGALNPTPTYQPALPKDNNYSSRPTLERFETAREDYENEGDITPGANVQDEDPRQQLQRADNSYISTFSKQSVPPPGSILTGKQEHCMWTPGLVARLPTRTKLTAARPQT